MLSGRYRTSLLCKYWSSNSEGLCLVGSQCSQQGIKESLCHILVNCHGLEPKRSHLKNIFLQREYEGPINQLLKNVYTWGPEEQTKFMLEPLTNPFVIIKIQNYGNIMRDKICYITRTFCFSLHKQRKIILGTWRGSGFPAPPTSPT